MKVLLLPFLLFVFLASTQAQTKKGSTAQAKKKVEVTNPATAKYFLVSCVELMKGSAKYQEAAASLQLMSFNREEEFLISLGKTRDKLTKSEENQLNKELASVELAARLKESLFWKAYNDLVLQWATKQKNTMVRVARRDFDYFEEEPGDYYRDFDFEKAVDKTDFFKELFKDWQPN